MLPKFQLPSLHLSELSLTDIIEVRVVEGIENGRGGGPLGLVNILPQPTQVLAGIKLEPVEYILKVLVLNNGQLLGSEHRTVFMRDLHTHKSVLVGFYFHHSPCITSILTLLPIVIIYKNLLTYTPQLHLLSYKQITVIYSSVEETPVTYILIL